MGQLGRKIRHFILGKAGREFFIFLLCVLFSFLFWYLKALNNRYEIVLNIPVHFTDIPKNKTFKDPLPSTVRVKISDKGTVLLKYAFNALDSPLEISLKKWIQSSSKTVETRRILSTGALSMLQNTTDWVVLSPEHINLAMLPQHTKRLPVRLDANIKLTAQYLCSGDTTITPQYVRVYGTKAALDTLDCLYTDHWHEREVNDTLQVRLALRKIKGINLAEDSVSVTIPVESFTEKVLEISVVPRNLPADWTLRTFPSKVKVICQVGLSQFKYIKVSDFQVCVDYEDALGSTNGRITPYLHFSPDYVRNIKFYPSELEFILEK